MPSCPLKKWPFVLNLKSELFLLLFDNVKQAIVVPLYASTSLLSYLSYVTEQYSSVHLRRTKLLCPCIVCFAINAEYLASWCVGPRSPSPLPLGAAERA